MRSILVSGGTSTLGRAICELFVKAGEKVYCGYASNRETADEMADSYGSSLIPIHLNVQDLGSIASVVKELEGLDVLVNNSGVFSVFTQQSCWNPNGNVSLTSM